MSERDTDTNSNFECNDLFVSARKFVELGIPLILLKKNHHPPKALQQKIAADPNYYSENIERLRKDIKDYKIKHLSILFGVTGIKDKNGTSLVLHGLDSDGEIFDKEECKKQIIEHLKRKTMVVKTRKPWGHLVLWLEHSQHHKPVKLTDCIDKLHCFEIKCQNNARADIPPSTHRDDETFHYSHVGLEKIEIMDGLYDKLVDEDLGDCISSVKHPYDSKEQEQVPNEMECKDYTRKFYSLSEETISALVPLARKYYHEGNHNNFTLHFGGMMWHASIATDSAVDIITKICQSAGDTEKLPKRIETIQDTYAKGNKGLKIAGTTEFINLVKHLTGCTKEEAENAIRRIKIVWRIDAPGPELKQPIIIGLGGNKNKNKRNKGIKDYEASEDDNDSFADLNFRSPSSAEILLRLAEKKILFLFANQFDECYACILVPDRVMLICYDKEGFKIDIHNSNNHVDNLSTDNITNSFAQRSHLENAPILSQKFKEYLMQIYREDSELQDERAKRATKEIKDQLLQDEVNKNLWKQANEKNSNEDEKNEEPIILHGKIVGSEAIKNVQMLLAYSARTKAPILPTYKRVAARFNESSFYLNGGAGSVDVTLSQQSQQLSKIYYALYDNQNRMIEITRREWTIKSSSENIIFNNNSNSKRQYSTQRGPYSLLPFFIRNSEIPQVEPSRIYSNNIFDTFMKLVNIKNEDEKLLVEVYILSLFIPEIPHYMLIPYGTYGAAKSFLFKLIKLLVDPDKPLLLTLPKEKEQFVQQLSHSLVLYYDNIENVPSWFNAEVCSAVTGGGHRKRRLFTDDDDFVYEYMRCLGFNGINVALTKPDSLSRSILIEMAEIDKQSIEEERYLFYKLSQIKPQLLGYIVDTLVKALNIYPTISLNRKVRMADYVVWGEAISQAMGNEAGRYAKILEANQNRQHVTAVLATPLGSFMIKFCKTELLGKNKIEWKGQPDDLMEFLTKMIDDKILRADKRELPGQSHKLVSELNIIKPNLRDGYGIRFENSHRPESGLSEISIKIDQGTFENAINYKSNNDDNNAKFTSDTNGCNSESENQIARSEKKTASDNDEVPASKASQHVEVPFENDYGKYRDHNSIKNRFGLGAEAEAWDNESYEDEDVDVGD